MSQFKTYCFLFISNDLHNCFTSDGSDRDCTAINYFKLGFDDQVKNVCFIIGLPSGVCLFLCGRLNR